MDPLSIASGVAGLITLAEVVISRTYNTIIACKHASEDSRKLLREVQALVGILQSLSSLESKLGTAALQSHIPAAQVLSCQQTLQNIRDKLEKSDPKENGISIFQKAKRTLKWPLSASDTDKFLAEMERHKSTFDLALSVDALDAILASQQAGEKTDTKIDDVVQALDRLCKIENTKEQRRILQLIGAEDADEAYRANLKLHQHGTGLWFLEEGKPFSTWLATPCSKLWVYGIPGAGKTILSALAIGKTAELASTSHGVAFYYCSHRDEQSRQLTGILRCLIGQLARQNKQCMAILEEKFGPQDHTSPQTWTRDKDELEKILRKMIRRFDSVSIVIDGIDECHEATAVTDTLASLASESPSVRLLIFSRKEAEMEPFLHGYTQMSIAAESQDLRLYVPSQIEMRTRLRRLRIKDPNVKDKIIETLVNDADGMFRWVACQLDHLCDLTTDEERLSALKRLPRTLESTYDRILERVNSRGESACELVRRSLFWIVHRHRRARALSAQQVCEAVSIDVHASSLDSRKLVDVEEILIRCSSLIRLSAGGDVLESAHFTVEEYLRAIDPVRKPHLAHYRLCDDLVNGCKAAICLTALTFDHVMLDIVKDYGSTLRWLRQFHFYFHAATFWSYYTEECRPTDNIRSLLTKLFCTPAQSNFEVWKHIWLLGWDESIVGGNSTIPNHWLDFTTIEDVDLDRPSPPSTASEPVDVSQSCHNPNWVKILRVAADSSGLHIAAMLHQQHLVEILAEQAGALDSSSLLGTPLHCALFGSDVLLVAFSNTSPEEVLYHTSLEPSLKAKPTVTTLLSLGADVNIPFRPEHGKGLSTAHIACWTDHLRDVVAAGAKLDRAVIDLLYDGICEIDKDDYPLFHNMDICELPECDQPAAIQLLNSLGKTPEQTTTTSVVQPFFSPNDNSKLLPEYEEALVTACTDNDLSFFQWVYESSGIAVDYRIGGLTFLHRACTSSSESVVEYLILHGANVNEPTMNSVTPLGLLLAYKYPGPRTVTSLKLLRAAGAQSTSLDEEDNDLLMCWGKKPCTDPSSMPIFKDMLDEILSFQPLLVHSNRAKQNVWHALALNQDGHLLGNMLKAAIPVEIIRTTIDRSDKEGQTPLLIAASEAHGEMMQLLIDLGSSLTKTTSNGETVLHLATAVLERSRLPFQVALAVYPLASLQEVDGVAALHEYIVSIFHDHRPLPADMPDRLENAMTELVALSPDPKLRKSSRKHLVNTVAHYFATYFGHDPHLCEPCIVRLECFQTLLHGPFGKRTSEDDDIKGLVRLCKGLRHKTADVLEFGRQVDVVCAEAICVILKSELPTRPSRHSLDVSDVFESAIYARQLGLIHVLLDFDISVDETGICLDGLTILQRLCQCSAPESVVRVALSRTKSLQARASNGDTLLHMPLRSYPDTLEVSVPVRETVVRLLVDAGVDINAKSTHDGATAVMLSSAFSPTTTDLLLKHNADTSVRDIDGRDALFYASEFGQYEAVRSLLCTNTSFVYIEYRSQYLGSNFLAGPFQVAALHESLDVLQTLGELAEVEKEREDRLGVPSTLWVACTAPSSLEKVQYLLKNGSDVNYRRPMDGTMPLHVAAAVGSNEVVGALLKAGADVQARDHRSLTAEMYALANGHNALAETIRAAISGATADTDGTVIQQKPTRFRTHDTVPDAISGLVRQGHLHQLRGFVSAGGTLALRLQSCECTPMLAALMCGQTDIVVYLQSLGVEPVGKTCHAHSNILALGLLAAQAALLEPLRTLLDRTPHLVTPQTFSHMMHSAAANGNSGALELMLAQHQLVEDAIQIQQANLPIYSVRQGQCYFYLTTNGTVLHTAVRTGQIDSVKLLLPHQPDPDVFDLESKPASHIAAQHGRDDIVQLLLSHGGEIDARDGNMRTTLASAVMSGHMSLVRLLLGRGANLSTRDFQGCSLCELASSSRNPVAFFALLEAGLDPSLEDIDSWCRAGQRQVWMARDHMKRLAVTPRFLLTSGDIPEMKAILSLVPAHHRKLNLTCRVMEFRITVLYRASTMGRLDLAILLHNAGAMLNLEGGAEGTPLMGACKTGRLDIVKYLVRNGAVLSYIKNGVSVNAFDKAASYSKVRRWLLVEQFTEQRLILDAETPGEQTADVAEEDTWTDEIANVTLDLVLEDDVERYLEGKNWFLPMRRFVDDGQGAFVRVPILPEEFARYRPLGFKVLSK